MGYGMKWIFSPREFSAFKQKHRSFAATARGFILSAFHILSGLVAETIPFPAFTAISIMGTCFYSSRTYYSLRQTLESFVLLKLIKVIHGVGKLFEGKKLHKNLQDFFTTFFCFCLYTLFEYTQFLSHFSSLNFPQFKTIFMAFFV